MLPRDVKARLRASATAGKEPAVPQERLGAPPPAMPKCASHDWIRCEEFMTNCLHLRTWDDENGLIVHL